jgi:hypothetical protein
VVDFFWGEVEVVSFFLLLLEEGVIVVKFSG